jgi:carbamoyl-phosphate synthase small subunit
MKAVLMLEDGLQFFGEAIGRPGESIGELILNTAVVGYQEMMTDPANAGKILVLTYPLIGNYGINKKFNESSKCWLSGLVVKEKSRIYSNWQAKSSFEDFVKAQGLLVINDIDTRTLTVHLRDKGEMLGIISTKTTDAKELLPKIREFQRNQNKDFLSIISLKKPALIGNKKARYKLAILDLGLTHSIIKQLETLGCCLHIFPYNTGPKEIFKTKPAGLIISNGPENDVGLEAVVNNVKYFIGKMPILGISTGHQVLAAALGAKINKMKLGHRGVNYPVAQARGSYKDKITVQNHSYVVDNDSLSRIKDIKITGYNLNDHTVEEMESRKLKLMGIQYYPTSPGFNEVNEVLKKFTQLLKN